MKKIIRYLEWIPFAIALGSLVIYLVYTIQIKLNPAIIITDKLISTLKTYLIIALVSLFVGLLIILIKKIRKLIKVEKREEIYKEEKVIINEPKKEEFIKAIEKEPIEEELILKEEPIIEEKKYVYKVEGIVCPECNNPIAKHAGICPHCGILFDDEIIKVLRKYDKKEHKKVGKPFTFIANILLTILFIILIFLICNMLYNKYNENLNKINYIIQRR